MKKILGNKVAFGLLVIGTVLAVASCATTANTPAQTGALQAIERRNSTQRDDFTAKEISEDVLLHGIGQKP
jgi:hypothetical protein